MANNPTHKKLNLKMVTQETIKKTIKKMHKKKSTCSDGLTQEQLILGSDTLSGPLTQIVNKFNNRLEIRLDTRLDPDVSFLLIGIDST